MTILIIDDEPPLRRMMTIALTAAGYSVRQADGVRTGLAESVLARPDCILLDLGLPDGSGVTVLSELRSWSDVPVIVLTAIDGDAEKVALLNAGADDFVTKPFCMTELIARIGAVTRRRTSSAQGVVYCTGRLAVDVARHNVRYDGHVVHLTLTEFAILRTLCLHVGKAVSYAQIVKSVWGPQAASDYHTVQVHVAQIRKKLAGFSELVTVTGYGYRLEEILPRP